MMSERQQIIFCHTIIHLNRNHSKELIAQSSMGDFNLEIVYNERKYVCKLFDSSLYSFKNSRGSSKFCVGYRNYFSINY